MSQLFYLCRLINFTPVVEYGCEKKLNIFQFKQFNPPNSNVPLHILHYNTKKVTLIYNSHIDTMVNFI